MSLFPKRVNIYRANLWTFEERIVTRFSKNVIQIPFNMQKIKLIEYFMLYPLQKINKN